MRKYGKTDANQKSIVDSLRRIGCSVQSIASVGNGVPDLIVGLRGINLLLEVKDGSLPPSARKLTEAETNWHKLWRGQVCVVNGPVEAIQTVLQLTETKIETVNKD